MNRLTCGAAGHACSTGHVAVFVQDYKRSVDKDVIYTFLCKPPMAAGAIGAFSVYRDAKFCLKLPKGTAACTACVACVSVSVYVCVCVRASRCACVRVCVSQQPPLVQQ